MPPKLTKAQWEAYRLSMVQGDELDDAGDVSMPPPSQPSNAPAVAPVQQAVQKRHNKDQPKKKKKTNNAEENIVSFSPFLKAIS